ncbi:hypothetical protein NQP46_21750 [Streptomyces albus]|nr:hypothetical protein NQP46_21750 [Streptomyces albus]
MGRAPGAAASGEATRPARQEPHAGPAALRRAEGPHPHDRPGDRGRLRQRRTPLGLRPTIREPDRYAHRLLRGAPGHPAADAVNLHSCQRAAPRPRGCSASAATCGPTAPTGNARAKREPSARNWTYTQQYADAKSEVVADILRRAG